MNLIYNLFSSKLLLGILVFLHISTFSSYGQYSYNDGPYIEYVGDSSIITWIDTGTLHKVMVHQDSEFIFNEERLPSFSLQDLDIVADNAIDIKGIKKFVALSDIHGQFDVFEKLLIANEIVDSAANWIYEDGHLVIVGDMLDRGDQVLKVLWYLYHLEKKARDAGGQVHILLGNHEMMVMNGDIGYINRKYRYTSGICVKPYQDFFSKDTFWGRWLLSKNVVKSINNVVFLHGGFSEKVLAKNQSFEEMNLTFRNKILHNSYKELAGDELLKLLTFNNGPLWYRGYAQPYDFDSNKANKLLKKLNKEVVVVGHTSMPKVMGLYGNKIILVDSSIKFGKSGEVLIYDEGHFYRGMMNGDKIPLIPEDEVDIKKDIHDELFEQKRPSLFLKFERLPKTVDKINGIAVVSVYFDWYGLDFSAHVMGYEFKKKRTCEERRLKFTIDRRQLNNFGYTGEGKFLLDLCCEGNIEKDWTERRINELSLQHPEHTYKAIRVLLRNGVGKGMDINGILISPK